MSFQEFWPRYLLAHSQPATRAFHVAGTVAATTLVAASVATVRSTNNTLRSATPMRKLLLCLATIALLGLTPHTPVFTDASQPVTVDAGEEFFIALPSNDTTGYTWSQAIDDGKILAYEGNVYQNPASGLIGGSGQQIFIYHANRSGTTIVHFSYGRPFEPNAPPAKALSFDVTVK